MRDKPEWHCWAGAAESGDFPSLRRLRAEANSSGLKGSQILWSSDDATFNRSDSSLLTSLVDSRSAVLCAPFFASYEAMEFAETEQRRKERPDLPVSLLVVLHGLRLEGEKSMDLTASSYRSCFFCSSRDSWDEAALSESVPLALGWRSDRGSCTLCPSMAHSSSDVHVGYSACPRIVGSRKNPGMPSQYLKMSAKGNLSTDSHVWRQKRFQSALQKSQCFTGLLWAGTLSLGGVIREDRCFDRGNFPRTHLSGSRLFWPKLAKARSGLVPTFHRWEKKLAVSFGSCNSPRLFDFAQKPGSQRQEMLCRNPSWHAGNWSRQHTGWGVGTSGWPLV